MYFLDQIKNQFVSCVIKYQENPNISTWVDTKPDWYKNLSPEWQEIVDSSGDNLDSLKKELDAVSKADPYFDDIENKEWFQDISPAQQRAVKKIEKEIETVLKPFIEIQSGQTQIKVRGLDAITVKPGEDDDELHRNIENTMDSSISVDKANRRIETLMSKVRNIESEKVREQRYKLVEDEYKNLLASPDLDESQKYIIWEKSFNQLTAGDFYALKKEKPELLAWLLLSSSDGKKVDATFLQTTEAIWSELRVNFGQNRALDQIIGAGDILPMRFVESVQINGQEGTRKGEPRPWYYTSQGEYLDIHDGYRIKITSVNKMDDAWWEEFSLHIDKRYQDIRGNEIIRSLPTDATDTLKFPQFRSNSDRDLLKSYITEKTPKYMQSYLVFWEDSEKTPVVSMKKPYTNSELSSALNDYKNIRWWISKYISNNEWLLDESSISISVDEFKKITWVSSTNQEFIWSAFISMLRDGYWDVSIKLEGKNINISTWKTIREVFSFWGGNLDLRAYKHLHPREASLKNNNPSGLTYNSTFMRTLTRRGIKAEIGTARPAREWWNYFSFPNIWEWIKAHNLLWDIKIRKQSHKTLGQLLSTWAVDTSSYKQSFWHLWNTRVSDLDKNSEVFHRVQMKQLRLESPGMYAILSQKWLLSSYNTIRV